MCWSAYFIILSWVLNSKMWFSFFYLLCSLSVSVKRCEEESRWQQNHFLAVIKNQSASAASLSSFLELNLNHISCHTDSAAQKWMYQSFCSFAWSCSEFQKLMFKFLSRTVHCSLSFCLWLSLTSSKLSHVKSHSCSIQHIFTNICHMQLMSALFYSSCQAE